MAKIPSVFRDVYYGPYRRRDSRRDLYKSTKDSLDFVQRLKLLQKLPVHQGCVNTICWNDTGEYILSGSDDQQLCITSARSYKPIVSMRTRHRANIFSAKFLPNTNDRKIISCSGDGLIIYTELDRPDDSFKNCFNCHVGTAYEIVTVPNDPNTFLSCGEDGTVRWFDLRTKTQCTTEDCKEDTLIDCQRPVTALAIDPIFPYQMAVGCCDSSVRIYDRRMLGTMGTGNFTAAHNYQGLVSKFSVPEFEGKSHRITSLVYSSDSEEVLVSYSSEYLYLFRIKGDETTPSTIFSVGMGDRDAKKDSLGPPPPMKRLRLRGDWSDTGPNARPERELRDAGQQRSLHANLMHHVSDVLTRMINDPTRQNRSSPLSARARSVVRVAQEMAASTAASTSNSLSNQCSCVNHQVTSTSDTMPNHPEPGAGQSELLPTPEAMATAIYSMVPDEPISAMAGETTDTPCSSLVDHSREDQPSLAAPDATSSSAGQSSKKCDYGCSEAESSAAASCSWDEADEEMALTDDRDPSEEPSQSLPESVNCVSQSGSRGNCARNTDIQMAGSSRDEPTTSREPMADSRGHHLPPGAQMRVRKVGICGPSTWVTSWAPPAAEPENSDPGDDSSDSSTDSDITEMAPNPPEPQVRARSASPFDILRSMDEALKRQVEEREEEDRFFQHLPQPILLQKFTGHRNARTMIKEANFWGENFVMSGSDCGHVFIWNRHTAELVMIMEADHHVVNCLQPHPYDPILATSGIDYDIKLWAPGNEEPNFEEEMAVEIMGRNEVMLEETRDTITVPASFMIRMLASFNHLRPGGIFARWRQTLRREPQAGED